MSLDETEDEEKFVNIEAFALSDQIVKLCKEGWFAEEQETENVEKMGLLHTNKDVIVAGKDTQEVDTDFLIIAVPILDHQVRGNPPAPTSPAAADGQHCFFLVTALSLGQLRGISCTVSAVSRLSEARPVTTPTKIARTFARATPTQVGGKLPTPQGSNQLVVPAYNPPPYGALKRRVGWCKQGMLECKFPVENRLITSTSDDLKACLRANGSKAYCERLSDFHLLLFLSRQLDLTTDIALLLDAVLNKTAVSEGYQLIIDSIAGIM